MRKSVVFHPFLSYQEVGELKAAFVGEDISKVRLKSRCLVLHFVDEKFTSTFWEVSLLILDQGNKVFQLSLFISWVFIRLVILYFFLFWGGLINIILDLDPIKEWLAQGLLFFLLLLSLFFLFLKPLLLLGLLLKDFCLLFCLLFFLFYLSDSLFFQLLFSFLLLLFSLLLLLFELLLPFYLLFLLYL